ncbi:MAG: chromosome segregation protein SMC [Phycisphaerae bacterium]
MRLAKLTVTGFKSFADRTEFSFDHPITGVVGPNGCGKSNIVDAIKWVLGERSSKSLRGTEMLDVIFAGSAGRKPGGMASVSLTFENPIVERPIDDLAQPVAIAVPGGEGDSAPNADGAAADASGQAAGERGADETASGEQASADRAGGDLQATGEESVVDASVRRRRLLPIDADVVEVERRLYRDGESAYLINGRKARLKDIRELFLDTGVGADAYSIIEQGKVDAMLLASPQERRVIFEEAAGIAKYKQRRIEAQRKLDRAQTNLSTAREELDSTERRLRLVRGQAAKARRFKELDAEFKSWRLALAFDQYDELEQRIVSIASRHNELGGVREAAGAKLAELEAGRQGADLARQEAASGHRALEQERLSAVHAEQQATQRRTMLERSIGESTRQAALDRDRFVAVEQRRQETERSIEQYERSTAEMAAQVAGAEGRLAQTGEQRAAVLEELNEKRQASQARAAAAARIDRERIGLLASIASDAKRADAVREQISQLADKAGRVTRDQEQLQEQVTQTRAASAAAAERVAALEAGLKQVESRFGSLSADRRELADKVARLDQDMVRNDSRRATLQEMVESRAGFAQAVRQVLAARDAGKGFTGVVAPLADLIETRADVEADAAAAVESALGADLQALVIESMAALPPREDFGQVKGRVAFLPKSGVARSEREGLGDALAGIPSDASSSRVLSLRSVVRPRAGHLDDAGLHDLLDRLLGRTFLVDDVDAAMLLAAGPLAGRRCRFITRQGGSLIDADGRVHAGSAGAADESTGILRRRIELETLQRVVADLSAQLHAQREQLRTLDAEAGAASAEAGRTRNELAQAQRLALTEQNRAERLEADAARVGRERQSLEQESAQLGERLAKLEEDRAKLKDRADSLGRLQEEEQAAANALEAEVKTIQVRADAAVEQATAAKVEVGRFTEQLSAARREWSRLQLSRDELARQARELDTQVQRLDARIAEHRQTIDEAVEQIAAAQANVIRLTAEVQAAHEAIVKAEQQVQEIGLQVSSARNEFSAVEREWHSLELQKRELEVKRENLQERSHDDLQLDLQAEYPEYQQMMSGGDVARIDTAQAALRIDSARDAIKKLGSVNLESIEEESNLEQQNEDLVRQVADIDAACRQLSELIERLNEVSRTLFGEVFTRIQANFGGDAGMFRKLFNGGKAEVRLMPLMKEVEDADGTVRKVETDQTDLLESGIEVIAKPPGKEPRSISQLSGGEKTLTAVALLMSIFRSKPSCFCVLDEVDAALDEGNVGRFNSVVREYTDRSSFIVITHNKRTMQSADRLYGVTMQERGVSTRVSVRFDQVGKNGEIQASGGTRDGTAPPRLEGAGGDNILNTGLTATPVVIVPAATLEPAGPGEAASPAKRGRAVLKPVKAEPATLRQALAAMRELASAPEETPPNS